MSASLATGRYAPSPSGPLHLGSLLAAVGSYLQARGQGAAWHLRIDDLDPKRVVPGAERSIIEVLQLFGLRWDGPVLYQSMRRSAYAQAIGQLKMASHAFECGCTRRESQQGPLGIEGPIYPGTCRNGLPPGRAARSLRLRVADIDVVCRDAVQGQYGQHLARDVGDFVIRRADGITAYQLATVVDDAAQSVGEVVRGADLLSSTPRQIYLQRVLDLPVPAYAHLPVLVDAQGEKLGKSTGALALSATTASTQLWDCLSFLGQAPPDVLRGATVTRLLAWAVDNWSLAHVPCVQTLTV